MRIFLPNTNKSNITDSKNPCINSEK